MANRAAWLCPVDQAESRGSIHLKVAIDVRIVLPALVESSVFAPLGKSGEQTTTGKSTPKVVRLTLHNFTIKTSDLKGTDVKRPGHAYPQLSPRLAPWAPGGFRPQSRLRHCHSVSLRTIPGSRLWKPSARRVIAAQRSTRLLCHVLSGRSRSRSKPRGGATNHFGAAPG